MVKNPPANAGDSGLISGLRDPPWRRKWQPTQYSCLENFMDREASGGYSPWSPRESDMTESD